LGTLFPGLGEAVVALSAVDLSSRGRGLGANFMVLVPPEGEVGQETLATPARADFFPPAASGVSPLQGFLYTDDMEKLAEGRLVAS